MSKLMYQQYFFLVIKFKSAKKGIRGKEGTQGKHLLNSAFILFH